jgi:putative glutamine amidotransferase
MTKDRVIRVATGDYFEYFQSLFPEAKVFNPENDSKLDIDLLIFSGGDDVGLDRYMNEEMAKRYEELVYTNPKRDAVEAKIFDLYMKGVITVNKVLGVCRGMQFINVMLGGTLYPDLPSIGKGHKGYHRIHHHKTHPLNYLSYVNSLHHQGLSNIGNYYSPTDKELRSKIIAYEDVTQIYEIVSWDNDRILGVQFHPEFFVDGTEVKNTFTEVMNEWIK